MLSEFLNLLQIRAHDLDADGCSYPCRKHVHPGLDRHGPGIGNPGKLHGLIKPSLSIDQLIHTFVVRPQAAKNLLQPIRRPGGIPFSNLRPFRFGFEQDDGFHHGKGGRIRGCLRAARLPEDKIDFRKTSSAPCPAPEAVSEPRSPRGPEAPSACKAASLQRGEA